MIPERIKQEREAFEAWVTRTWREDAADKEADGSYTHPETEMQFSAWCAAKSHATQSEWISVEDRMPECRNNLEQFLIACKWDSGLEKHFYRVSNVLNISKHVYFGDVPCDASVTHWQPLPAPPTTDPDA